MSRYEAGETLASIARTYDCSPPAISYIVSRSRDRQPTAEAAAPVAEPQLFKVHAEPVAAMAAAVAATPEPAPAPVEPPSPPPAAPAFAERNSGLAATLARGLPQRPNGAAPPGPPPAVATNGDARRTLHLSLGGNGDSNGQGSNGQGSNGQGSNGAGSNGAGSNGAGSNGAANGGHGNGQGNGNGYGADSPHTGGGYRPQAQPQERPEPRQPPQPQPRYGFPPNGERAFNEAPSRIEARSNKDPGTFIDQELRDRVDGDIAAFLAAFDAALAGDTLESRAGLREATDRLLRAGARTRIELERLEARVPLGVRESESRAEPHWRHR
jgi:hypothetical protein